MDGTEAVPTGAHWGIYDVLVADGRVVGARPWDGDPDPAPLNAALPELVDHPTRIARPMVRAGYHNAGPGSDTAGRGAEPFVPVSWERALDLVAGELQRVKRAHGNEAIYAGSYGWASAGKNPPSPHPGPPPAQPPWRRDRPCRQLQLRGGAGSSCRISSGPPRRSACRRRSGATSPPTPS